jgi:hypothetical protein
MFTVHTLVCVEYCTVWYLEFVFTVHLCTVQYSTMSLLLQYLCSLLICFARKVFLVGFHKKIQNTAINVTLSIIMLITKTKKNMKTKTKTITDAKPGDRVELIAGTYVAKYKYATFVSWPLSLLQKKSMHVRFDDGNTACLRLSSLRLIVDCDSPASPAFSDGSIGNGFSFGSEKVPVYLTEEQLKMLGQLPHIIQKVDSLSVTVDTLSVLVKELLAVVKKS